MERVAECKSLVGVFGDDKLMLGLHEVRFDIKTKRDQILHACVEQDGIRKIIVTSDEDVSAYDLYATFSHIDKLLMILDGKFVPLSEIQLTKSDTVEEGGLRLYEKQFMRKRLSYFSSADFCSYNDKMIEFDSIITSKMFCKWENLLDELDVVHQVYLYSLSDNKMPIDIKRAFLIELAEPLVEIVKNHTNCFSSLNPGNRGTTLKICLEELIKKYGEDIFKNELSNSRENFLSALVNSRVRIMHIKREQKGVYFNGTESILYILKMSLLYRKILFELLNIKEVSYIDRLRKRVLELDEWNDTLNNFLIKISK